jgi:uncharacterized membrane protein YdfJ with MMPL/SSD domain
VFGRWAHLMYRRRRLVLGIWLVVLVMSIPAALQVGSVEGPGTFTIPNSPSDRVATILSDQLHQSGDTDVLIVVHCKTGVITDPSCASAITTLIGRVRSDAALEIRRIDNPLVTHHGDLISRDRTSLALLISNSLDQGGVQNQVPTLQKAVLVNGVTAYVTGNPPLNYDSIQENNQDLERGNLIALPVLLIVRVLVFGALAAAGMPVVLALFSIPMALSGVWIFAHFIDTSIYANNVVEVLGLGLTPRVGIGCDCTFHW